MSNILSLAFALFLGAACLVYYVLPRFARSAWLLCCSYLFYLYDPANAVYVLLLAGVTGVTYLAGLALEAARARWLRRCVLAACCIGCFGVLAWFKYSRALASAAGAIAGLFGARAPGAPSVAVPLGISYFLFMAAGYLIDVYRQKTPAVSNVIDYALFVSFFPLMTAGPIERADHLIPQFQKLPRFDYDRFCGGMFRILWGFFKKMVIADTLGGAIGQVYGNLHYEAYTGPVVLLASLLFSFRLYCDFAACSDIAVGAAQLFGIDLIENFRRPFSASSFTELWRRWHISLTSWLRDYVYISLGGNRCGKARTYLNQIVTFIVSGLWHGGSLPYAVWGLLNGVFLSFGKLTAARRRRIMRHNPLYHFAPVRRVCCAAVNYLLFTACIVFLAVGLYNTQPGAIADAFYVYGHIFTGWGELASAWPAFLETLDGIGLASSALFALVAGTALMEALEWPQIPVHKLIRKVPIFIRWPLYYVLCLGILFFGSLGQSGFIYQNY